MLKFFFKNHITRSATPILRQSNAYFNLGKLTNQKFSTKATTSEKEEENILPFNLDPSWKHKMPYKKYRKLEEECGGNVDTSLFPNQLNYKYEEHGFKQKGLEATRYNDWERKGRVTDF